MFNFQHFMGLGVGGIASYSVQLRAFSAPFFQKYDEQKINDLNHGGKILLPNSCLDNLTRRHVQWPVLFKLTNLNPDVQKATHAGVLEFLAEEGKCYLPSWMMNQLQLVEGDLIQVEYKALPNATFAKFKPMSTDFYHISNPRAMLEVELRKFSCLTKGDVIAVQYNEQEFGLKVMNVKPENAVTIIECDVNIEFDTADGYVETGRPQQENREATAKEVQPPVSSFKAFAGEGHRLDGKKPRTTSTTSQKEAPSTSAVSRAEKKPPFSAGGPSTSSASQPQSTPVAPHLAPIIVDENYKPGALHFVRTPYKSRATLQKEADEAEKGKTTTTEGGVKPFAGKGNTIRSMPPPKK